MTGAGVTADDGASIFLGDADGTVVEVDASPLDASGAASAVVPADAARWQLIAVDVDVPPATGDEAGATSPGIAVDVSVDGARLDPAGWSAVATGSQPVALGDQTSARLSAVLPPGGRGVRFLAGTDDPLPVIVSSAFLDASGLALGDGFPLNLWSVEPVTATIAGVTTTIPGADSAAAVLIDAWSPVIDALAWSDQPPQPFQAWVGATDPASAAAALRGAVPETVAIDGTAVDSARAISQAAPAAMWWGALGAAVLALVGAGAASSAARVEASAEAAALRTAGVDARGRRVARVIERAVVVAAGLILGAAGGAAVTALLIPALAQGAAPSESIGAVPAVVDGAGLAATIPIFAAVLVVVVAVTAGREPAAVERGAVS